MPIKRSELIDPDNAGYYHLMSRCVRRAFLCGTDHYSGQCFEHRRQWIVDRIRLLSSLFAIDVKFNVMKAEEELPEIKETN